MNDMLVSSGMELGIALAAITTLATALTIGIAFLVKPGRATLYWSIAFTLAMTATYGVVAGELNDAETLRRVALGALLGAPAFLWSGFRAWWGLTPYAWTGFAMAAVAGTALALAPDMVWFTLTYRVAYLAASVFAGLFFLDWVRGADRRNDRLVLPMAIVSIAFFVLGVGTLFTGLLFPPTGGDDFGLLRMISSVGMLAYVGCALVAVVGLATRDGGLVRTAAASNEWQRFERTAGDRLVRAAATGEPWSIVYLHLDDAADIRQTAGASALADLSRRFERAVGSVFPAEADIGSPGAGTVVVLVPRPDATVRDYLRTILDRVPQLDVHGSLAIRPTASAGWAPVSTLGYDLDALIYTAREASALASEQGGDRWERVGATVVDRLISRSETPRVRADSR